MRKFVSRSQLDWTDGDYNSFWFYRGQERTEHLSVDERGPRFTGILDAEGNELYELPEPLGFHHPLD